MAGGTVLVDSKVISMIDDSTQRPRVAVLMGGKSAEREISLLTGGQVASALEEQGFPVSRIDAGETLWNDIESSKSDVVFIALHGLWGEDGTVQALLELMGVPYTGSGVLASALAMDKKTSKTVLHEAGLPVAKSMGVHEVDWAARSDEILADVLDIVGVPCVAKPSKQGSAVGVGLVKDISELRPAIDEALRHDDVVLVEKFLPGRELTIGVIGSEELQALPSVEIAPQSSEFYDYEAKYTEGGSTHTCPADIPKELEERIAEMALTAHRAIGCRDISRTDFKLDDEGEPRILEINTIPGMTPTSLFPEAARAAGISFPELVTMLVEAAHKRSGS